jgi:hypothetical protein
VSNQQSDKRLLGAMVAQTLEVTKRLGVEEMIGMVADAGYFNEADILANQQGQAIRVTVPIAPEGERGDSKEKIWGAGQVPLRYRAGFMGVPAGCGAEQDHGSPGGRQERADDLEVSSRRRGVCSVPEKELLENFFHRTEAF